MSSFPLPPISTLSTALSSATVPIAPELMGVDGLPPDRRVSYDEVTYPGSSFNDHTGYPGYQSSSARDDSSWPYPPPPISNHWSEGYRDAYPQPEPEPSSKGSGSGNVRKRARPKLEPSPEQPGEYEHEHPSSDPKMGPVFIHPPKGAAQACERCHKIKRKCDNARPRCAGCSKADAACVFELNAATSTYVHNLKADNTTLTAQIAAAHDRINQLETLVSSLERNGQTQPMSPTAPWPRQSQSAYSEPRHSLTEAHLSAYPESRPTRLPDAHVTGHNDQATGYTDPPSSSSVDFPALAKQIISVRSTSLAPTFGAVPLNSLHSNRSPSHPPTSISPSTSTQPHPTQLAYPPYALALQAVETFFICNAISYPFLDKRDFLRDLDEAYAGRGAEGKEFVMFMVIAVGTTNRERMGEVERGSSRVFRGRAMMGLEAAVAREDILCVQSLLLLGIYSMFDPSEVSLWHVVGFAARVAIALNLHRRVDDATLPPRVVEQRKRVFYSLYNLDRLVAATMSKPLAIADDDIDVELPSVLPTDSPYRGVPRIAFTQHIIKLRRLSGIILTTVYSVSGSQNSLPEPERAGIINDLHSRFDSWLAECPMPPSEEAEKRGMINNHSWFLLNYHQGLCLLYRPSPLYPVTTAERLRALHEASTRCVDLYLELWHEQKVSYNLINVSCQFLACISLLYCLCEYDNRSPQSATDLTWRREVSTRVGQCHELLEAFGRALPETAKYRKIFGKLSEMLLSRHGQPTTGSSAYELPSILPQPHAPHPAGTMLQAEVDQSEGGTAWNAMTQLWHDSGDFQFDEAVLGRIHDERERSGPGLAEVLRGAMEGGKLEEGGGVMGLVGVVVGDGDDAGGSGPMLWNQLG